MQEEFFKKIDDMLKETLDHPVPQILLEQNKSMLKEYKLSNTPLDESLFIKNFLMAHGYTFIDQTINGDLMMHYDKDNNPRTVRFKIVNPQEYDEKKYPFFKYESVDRPDYGILLVADKNYLLFIKPDGPYREVKI